MKKLVLKFKKPWSFPVWNRWMDGWMDGRTDGRTDRQTDRL